MLHVILFILKILGILFLACLILLLLLLYAVLFVAVSYRLWAKKDEEHFLVSVSAAWLFRAVTVHLRMDEDTGLSPVLKVRLFGCTVRKLPGGEEADRSGKRFSRKRRRRKKQKQPEQEKKKPLKEEPAAGTGKEAPAPVCVPSEGGEKKAAPPKTAEHREKPSLFSRILQKIRAALQKIFDKIRRIREKITEAGKGIRRLKDKKDDFLNFWRLPEHRRARAAVLREAKYLWRKSGPKKVRGQLLFGFSDPACTGACMGIAGMFCAWYPKGFQVIPDFDREILKGEIRMRGKIRCYVFVKILLRIYFNKEIRHMYQHWQEL